jgi:hypothetical protein
MPCIPFILSDINQRLTRWELWNTWRENQRRASQPACRLEDFLLNVHRAVDHNRWCGYCGQPLPTNRCLEGGGWSREGVIFGNSDACLPQELNRTGVTVRVGNINTSCWINGGYILTGWAQIYVYKGRQHLHDLCIDGRIILTQISGGRRSGITELVYRRAGRLGFEPCQGKEIFLFATASRVALRPTQPIQWHRGVKRSECEADHSPHNTEVKNS